MAPILRVCLKSKYWDSHSSSSLKSASSNPHCLSLPLALGLKLIAPVIMFSGAFVLAALAGAALAQSPA